MASDPIHIHDDSELPRLIDEAAERPVRFRRGGVVYLLYAEPAHVDWTDEDHQAVVDALNATAGAWSDIDADRVIEELYEARRRGSRPATRP